MKKSLIIIGLGMIFTAPLAFALDHQKPQKPHVSQGSDKMNPMKLILFKDVELTAEQKSLLRELRGEHRDAYRAKDLQGEDVKKAVMEGLLYDQLTIEEAHQKLDKHHERRSSKKLDKIEGMHTLLDTYSEEQKNQVLLNIDELGELAEQKNQRSSHRESLSSKGIGLTKGIELTATERAAAQELRVLHMKQRQNRQDRLHLAELESYLLAEMSEDELMTSIEEHIEEHLAVAHKKLDLWSVLVADLDDVEREILADNIEKKSDRRPPRHR